MVTTKYNVTTTKRCITPAKKKNQRTYKDPPVWLQPNLDKDEAPLPIFDCNSGASEPSVIGAVVQRSESWSLVGAEKSSCPPV